MLEVAWSPSDAVVAIATDNHQINFYQDEGQIMVQCAITRECDVSCMVWQAKNKILATGWEDGHIAIYSLNNQKLDCVYSNDKDHSGARLSFLMWNPMSSRLVSGDSAGVVRVWKSDSRGALSMYKQYKCNSATTAGVFSTAGHMQSRSDVLGHAFSPSFFYGTMRLPDCCFE